MRRSIPAAKGLVATLVLVLFLPVVGSAAGPAVTGLSYLKVGVGARSVAIGNAVVSHVDDASAMGWNPGALPLLTGTNAELTHQESLEGVRNEYAALAHALGARHGAGISFQGAWTSPLKKYDLSGQYEGEFGYSDIGLSIGYGFSPIERVGVGAAVEYLREAIDTFTATGIAWNFGVQAREILPRTDAGFAVLHLGSDMKFETQAFRLPLTMQGGVSHLVPLSGLGGTVRLAVEMRKVRYEKACGLVGTEYEYQHAARVQVGYRSGQDSESMSFGMGVGKGRIRGQYSFVPFKNNLGDQHRIAVQMALP
jgi:hypothetical protein